MPSDKMKDEMEINNHLNLFVKSFVEKRRQERWINFLCNRPKQTYKHSSDLLNHLDNKFYTEVDSVESIPENGKGVFYDFSDEPEIISFSEASEKGWYQDAIFSYKPGKLAVYFFHEGWIFLCKR